MLQAFFLTILLMSVSGGLLMMVILALRPVTVWVFSGNWNYNVLKVAAVFFLIPVGAAIRWLLPAAVHSEAIPNSLRTAGLQFQMLMQGSSDSASHSAWIGLPDVCLHWMTTCLPYIWVLGAAVSLAYKGLLLKRFQKRLRLTNVPLEDEHIQDILKECKTRMRVRKPVVLVTNPLVQTPMLVGLRHTYLILPQVGMNGQELRLIFQHELIHFQQRDLWMKSAALLINALHWFNPLAYKLNHDVGTYSEISCDESVIRDMSMHERRFYGETILNILGRVLDKQNGIYSTLCGTKKEMERRLIWMISFKKASKRMIAVSLISLLVLGMGGIATASTLTLQTGEVKTADLKVTAGDFHKADGSGITISGSDGKTLESSIGKLQLNITQAGIDGAKGLLDGGKLKLTTYALIDSKGANADLDQLSDKKDSDSAYLWVGCQWNRKENLGKDAKWAKVELDGKSFDVAFTGDAASYADDSAVLSFAKGVLQGLIQQSDGNIANESESLKAYAQYIIENGTLSLCDIQDKDHFPKSVDVEAATYHAVTINSSQGK